MAKGKWLVRIQDTEDGEVRIYKADAKTVELYGLTALAWSLSSPAGKPKPSGWLC